MRLEQIKLPNKTLIISDCYNANPDSMIAAINVVSNLKAKRKMIVVGDMMELGDYAPTAHRNIGKLAAEKGFFAVFSVGQFSKDVAQGAIEGELKEDRVFSFQKLEDLQGGLNTYVKPGDLVLFKGSRAMKLEKAVKNLRKFFEGESV